MNELIGKPDDKIIIGNYPRRFILSHTGDGKISIMTPDGEGGWYDIEEFAKAIADFVAPRL